MRGNKYEISVESAQKKRFKEVLRARMADRGVKIGDLPNMVNYEKQSVYNFMSANSWNRFLAAELAEKFNISEKEWKNEKT